MKIRVVGAWLYLSLVILAVAGCKPNTTPTNGVPVISVQPVAATITIGQTATFSVTASGSGTLTYQWFKNGIAIAGGTAATYMTPPAISTDNNAFFFCYVSNSIGSTESSVVILTVNPATSTTSVRSNNSLTGMNSNEVTLTPGNVNPSAFGKTGFIAVDGAVNAQPLYLSEVNVPGKGVRDVLYVATENDTVFAIDGFSGELLWRANVAGTDENPGDNSACNPASPNAGISATPVIDRTRGPNGAIYLVAKSRDVAGITYERLHALDVSTGAELFGGPTTIPASLPGGAPAFDAAVIKAQNSLLVSNGNLYAAWGASCDSVSSTPPSGSPNWTVAFDTENLAITKTMIGETASSQGNSAPNVAAGGIIWLVEGGESGVLHAYDAADLSHELYNSKQAPGGRDDFGPGNSSPLPLVVNGRVYVGTLNGVAVFSLLK
ncbi:MAG TPA: immunoglobulin domain-containing protein [Candidatus Acidoferrum sp.]|nr:immunoglobulin domain-containing protein [Candidatus Acidoferrum sp.]